MSYPPLDKIKEIYEALGMYCRLPVGCGAGSTFDFDNSDFARQCGEKPITTFNALRFIEKAGLVCFTDPEQTASRLYFCSDRDQLYRFQVANKAYDPLIKLLLRSYTGLFSQFTRVDEGEISRRAGLPLPTVTGMLHKLDECGILIYQPRAKQPQLTWLEDRMDSRYVRLTEDVYAARKEAARRRLDAVKRYVLTDTRCRSSQLVAYFGEKDAVRCGKCDVCRAENKAALTKEEFNSLLKSLRPLLENEALTLEELVQKTDIQENKLICFIRWMLDNGKLRQDERKKLHWS